MYTQQQIAKVFAYNKQHTIFYITESKRVMFNINNSDKAQLQNILQNFETAEHLAQLKKQVKAQLKERAVLRKCYKYNTTLAIWAV